MNDAANTRRPRGRKRYLIDKHLQLSIVLPMIATLFVLTLVFVITMLVSQAEDISPSSDATLRLGIIVTGAYFLMVLAATLVTGILATHRVAGPARVLESAIRGLRRHDFGQRTELRGNDHLQSLAAAVTELRDTMRDERDTLAARDAEIEQALEAGDTAGALRLLRAGADPVEQEIEA